MKILLPKPDPLLNKSGKRKVISVCEPSLNGNECKYLIKCIKSNWISSAGDFIERFENIFKKRYDVKYAVTCSSGTAALHLALSALGIKKGDEVIVPTFTMIATANVVTYLGGKPVLVDADYYTRNIDTRKIEAKINKHTKAIIPVHTYGLPADMDEVVRIAKKYNLYVIEDAAEVHGAEYKQRMAGSIGDIGCFSFYGNKIITTGEGGMLITDIRKIAENVRILRDHGFSKKLHFWHEHLGYNYRMTNMQAAIGLAQMERFEELVETRIRNAEYYSLLLKDIKGIRLPPEMKNAKNVYWMYSILIEDDFGLTRDDLRKYLAWKGIETRTFFIPIHMQPIYRKKYNERFPVAEELCRKGMYLPSGANLSKKEIEYIAECVKSAKKHAK
jgi:perosamine synthetase